MHSRRRRLHILVHTGPLQAMLVCGHHPDLKTSPTAVQLEAAACLTSPCRKQTRLTFDPDRGTTSDSALASPFFRSFVFFQGSSRCMMAWSTGAPQCSSFTSTLKVRFQHTHESTALVLNVSSRSRVDRSDWPAAPPTQRQLLH